MADYTKQIFEMLGVTAVCYGWNEAAETILQYLKEGKTNETEKD